MFELNSREGLPIRGDIDAPRKARALVVVVHGFQAFKDWGFFPWLSERLAAEELAAVRFNMSRSGIGDDPETIDRLDLLAGDTYSAQLHDLVDVCRYVRSRFRGLPLFLLGHSRGGGVALLAAREIRGLAGIVTWSAISRANGWGGVDVSGKAVLADFEAHRKRLDILDSAARLRVPLLSIHGGRDESVPVENSREIVARARDASLVVIQSASHTFNAIHPLIHVPRELEMAAAVTTHFVSVYA